MNRLVRYVDGFRGFTFHSLFVADDDDWERIKACCESNETVYFGEIAGKHSDVSTTLNLDDFEILSEDQNFIESFIKTVGREFGESILGHLGGEGDECEECGETLDDDGCCAYCDESEVDENGDDED